MSNSIETALVRAVRKKKIEKEKFKSKKRLSILGYGTIAYFNLLEQLVALFLILSLLCLPKYLIYWQFGENKLAVTYMDTLETGHLGYASA